eukprot:2565536-Amphidinium_carterae.1
MTCVVTLLELPREDRVDVLDSEAELRDEALLLLLNVKMIVFVAELLETIVVVGELFVDDALVGGCDGMMNYSNAFAKTKAASALSSCAIAAYFGTTLRVVTSSTA